MTTYIENHSDRAVALLGSKVRDITGVEGIVRALVDEIQLAEDSLYDVAISRTLEGATGAQLELLGGLLGEPREGLSDVIYRRFIEGALQIRLSKGTVPEIIDIIASLTGATDVRYIYTGPRAAYVVYTVPELTPDDLRARIRNRVNRGAPAGVEIALTEVVTVDDIFLLDETPGFDGPLMGIYY